MIHCYCPRMYTVLHTLDWQRALSNAIVTVQVATTKLKSSTDLNKKKTTLLARAKDSLMYALVLTNALLDATLSVASSVVVSRLLISGDVESNPGPGRYSGENSMMIVCIHACLSFHVNVHTDNRSRLPQCRC